jgi:hypothetical protein
VNDKLKGHQTHTSVETLDLQPPPDGILGRGSQAGIVDSRAPGRTKMPCDKSIKAEAGDKLGAVTRNSALKLNNWWSCAQPGTSQNKTGHDTLAGTRGFNCGP